MLWVTAALTGADGAAEPAVADAHVRGAAEVVADGAPEARPVGGVSTESVDPAEPVEGAARGYGMILELPALFAEAGDAVEQAFIQLAEGASSEPVRGWLPWLAAAGALAVAAETSRRQLRPRRTRAEENADAPPPGWLPDAAGYPLPE
jgi:hypothetical protein